MSKNVNKYVFIRREKFRVEFRVKFTIKIRVKKRERERGLGFSLGLELPNRAIISPRVEKNAISSEVQRCSVRLPVAEQLRFRLGAWVRLRVRIRVGVQLR